MPGQRIIDVAMQFAPWEARGLAVAAVALFLVVATVHPKVLIFSTLASFAAMVSNSAIFTLPPIDIQALALVQAVYLGMLRGRLPRFSVLREGIFPAIGAFILLGVALVPWATSTSTALNGLLKTAFAGGVAWVLLCATDGDEMRSALRVLSGATVILSIVWVYVDPGAAIDGSRWRGITTNANTLGIFAGLFFLSGRGPRSQWSLAPVAWVLLGSASRASTFGLGLVAGPKLLERQSKWIRRLIATVAIICAIPIINAVFFSSGDASGGTGSGGPSVVRTTNSRADFWAEAVDLIQLHPFTGVGVGSEPSLVSSSILSPMVQIGLFALLPLGLVARGVVKRFTSGPSMSRSVFLFLAVNAFFEMWLFAGGSVIFLLFTICAVDPDRITPSRGEPSDQNAVDDQVNDEVYGRGRPRRVSVER